MVCGTHLCATVSQRWKHMGRAVVLPLLRTHEKTAFLEIQLSVRRQNDRRQLEHSCRHNHLATTRQRALDGLCVANRVCREIPWSGAVGDNRAGAVNTNVLVARTDSGGRCDDCSNECEENELDGSGTPGRSR